MLKRVIRKHYECPWFKRSRRVTDAGSVTRRGPGAIFLLDCQQPGHGYVLLRAGWCRGHPQHDGPHLKFPGRRHWQLGIP